MGLSRRSVLKTLSAAAAAPFARSAGTALPGLDISLGTARAHTDGQELTLETGIVLRRWRLTGNGLVTTALNNLRTGKAWAVPSTRSCDWSLASFSPDASVARLVSLTAQPVRFDPYTSDHLKVAAEIEYPGLRVLFIAWAYPNAPGIRTQISVQGLPRGANSAQPAAVDYLPIDCSRLRRRAAGYYNDTQHRNSRDMEILREEVREAPQPAREIFDWASLLSLERGGEGVCIVKESHKCVNQPGVDTGAFECDASGVVTTGWGVGPADLLPDRFLNAWATWTIVFDGGDDGRELAIKSFDRCRYPVDPQRDIYTMSNTWGSSVSTEAAKNAAREENVLRQIEACRDIGIDIVQIDDGWQGNGYDRWEPSPERYPNGWGPVREAARRASVKLGVWSSWVIGENDLERNYDRAGFHYFKIDFARLSTYQKLEALMQKIRGLVEYSGQTVRVNWDVTENAPRVGYYFAREFGNVYLENRKPQDPAQVVYVPYLVLRDAWQVSKYAGLNKFLVSVQNIDRVSRERSNAFRYNHAYSVAIALMGTPLFFQEVSFYSREARNAIRPLLAIYKRHRREIFNGYTFPIGDKPSDASWTGFQNHNPSTMTGYALIFRELNAPEAAHTIPLKFLAGRQIRLVELRDGTVRSLKVPADGSVRFELGAAPDFGLYRYELEEKSS